MPGKAWVVQNLRASCWLNASIRQLPQQDEPFVPMPLLIAVITEGTETQSLSKRLYAHGCCWMLFRLSYITINQKSLFTRRKTYHAAVMGKMPHVSNLVMHSLFFVFSMEIFLKLKEGWFWKMIDNTHILYRLQKFLEKIRYSRSNMLLHLIFSNICENGHLKTLQKIYKDP